MVDFFIDKILSNHEVELEWMRLTKELFKVNSFDYMLDKFLDATADATGEYYTKNKNFSFEYAGEVKITDIADKFGLKPLGKSIRICPFHADEEPSLSLSNKKGCFNCFGCGKKGNLVTFYALLKKVNKNGVE